VRPTGLDLCQTHQPAGVLFQDLATLPFLVVIDSGSAAGSIVFVKAVKQLMVATLSLGELLWLGRPVLRIALEWSTPVGGSIPARRAVSSRLALLTWRRSLAPRL
jgi:hypothetical protein